MKIQYCPSCGAKLTENARFCGGCGQMIEQPKESKETKTKQCPSCDYSTTNEEAFCPECGTALISSTKPESPKKESATQHTAKKKHPAAKKKTGFLRALGKLVLWVFAFLVVVMIALYFIGDSKDSQDYNREETLQNIAEEEMGFPDEKNDAIDATATDADDLGNESNGHSDPKGIISTMDVEKAKKTAEDVEKAFAKADVNAIINFMSEAALKRSKEDIQNASPERLKKFAKDFDKRRITGYGDDFIEFEFDWNGLPYTVDFSLQEDGSFKILRL
jgi:predicted RNA-binding Zn-ribbon protein involved in translation (DUF1610 family)